MTRQIIDKLSEKLRQQDRQIETQAATITALRRKLANQERANKALEAKLSAQAAQGRQRAELGVQRPAERLAGASGGDT